MYYLLILVLLFLAELFILEWLIGTISSTSPMSGVPIRK